MVLDLNLPALNGLEVCRILRGKVETRDVPIIMLTARTSETDRIVGLDSGADDYITKPFSLRELAARVRAVLRRGRPIRPLNIVYRGDHLVADFDAVHVTVDGEAVRLTRREFELLKYLVNNRTASSHATGCWSASGVTRPSWRRVRSTCMWAASGRNSAPPEDRSRPLWARVRFAD